MTRKKDVLSNSEQCEKGLLCSFIRSPEKVGDLCLFRNVTEKWFYDEDRQKIFTCLTQMRKEGKPIETLSVVQYCIDNDHKLKFATPFIDATVMDSSEFIATASNATYYVDQLQKCLAKREFQLALLRTTESLKTTTELQDLHDLATGAFKEVFESCATEEKKNWKREEMMGFIEEIEGIASKTRKPDVMPFFLPSIDEEVGGMKRGEMCLIQAPTSGGKSIAGGMIITKNAVERDRKAAVFTFEMPTRQYLKRTTASLGNISLASMRDGSFSKHELNSFMDIQTKIEKAHLEFYDVQRCKPIPSHIEAAVRREKKNKGLDIILVDHLNLIQFPGSKSSRKDQDLTDFANGLKLLALELEIAVILLAQSNKDGSVFDSTQVESACDFSFSLTPTFQTVGGVKKVNGTDGLWINKMREGRRGWKIPLYMNGKFAQIYEPETK